MENREDMDLVAEDGSMRPQRACDSCRSRKIRCDRATPCSNCRASKLTCTTTAPTQKVQRQRVHISDEYEKKIDRIEDRLAGIENVLESLAAKLGNLSIQKDSSDPNSQSRSSRVGSGKSPHSSTAEASTSTPAPFEGDTAMNSQSVLARELLEHAVGSTPSIGQNAEIQAALASLQDMVNKRGQYVVNELESQPIINKSLAEIDAAKLDRPPWKAVEEVLDRATNYPTMSLAVVFPFIRLNTMKDMMDEVYHSPEECSTTRRILTFGVLYNLFIEFSEFPLVGVRVEKYRAYSICCRKQMEVAMSQISLYLGATFENILALLIVAAYTIELCKPTLCGIFIAKAAFLCMDLGYHRIQTMQNDSDEERSAKLHVFWFIYTMDKVLSLRLGRASVIQDWDMSLPYAVAGQHPLIPLSAHKGGSEMLVYWIKLAQVQGQTYEKLFSPAAFLKSPEERAQIATELVNTLNQAWAERGEANVLDFAICPNDGGSVQEKSRSSSHGPTPPATHKKLHSMHPNLINQLPGSSRDPIKNSEGFYGTVGDLFYHSDVVMHYSTCTLIQRGVNSDNTIDGPWHRMSQDCLESARAALVAHARASERYNTKGNEELWAGYVHWSILQAPFTPFIVIFCNAIVHCDPSDLNSLSEFVLSLESVRTVSEGADKLYKMCHLFLRVAKLYVDARSKENSERSQGRTQSNQDGFYVTSDGEQSLDLNSLTQFDPYLSALGLMPNSAWPMAHYTPNAPIPPGMEAFAPGQGTDASTNLPTTSAGILSNQNNVQDWFSGSRYLMNLMEDDINMPDLNL